MKKFTIVSVILLLVIIVIGIVLMCKREIKFNTPKSEFGTGAITEADSVWAKIPVYGQRKNIYSMSLSITPSTFSLTMPPVGNQGAKGFCTSFACGYYALSAYWYKKLGATSYDFATNIFSPEWLADQTQTTCTSGASIIHELFYLQGNGDIRWAGLPYVDSCMTPSATPAQIAEAANYKIPAYAQVPSSDIITMKTLLQAGNALIFQFSPDEVWFNGDGTQNFIWKVRGTSPYSLHANCVVGWDDSKNAWLTINQYGTNWGDSGYRWIDYNFFATDVATAILFIQDTVITPPPPPPPPPPPSDTTKPIVTIINPVNNYKITKSVKTINVTTSATDNVGVVSKQILIDGSVVSTGSSYSWSVKWITKGQHAIAATAKDAAGNQGTKSITVYKQ